MNNSFCSYCTNPESKGQAVKHPVPLDLCILETTKLNAGQDSCFLLDKHVERMHSSALFFRNYWRDSPQKPFNCIPSQDQIRQGIMDQVCEYTTQHGNNQTLRIRILLDVYCKIQVQIKINPKEESATKKKLVSLSKFPINSDNPFVSHKTTHRDIYNFVKEQNSARSDIFDVILYNLSGMITETTIANIAIEVPSDNYDQNNETSTAALKLITPSISSGLLPGTMRNNLIESLKMFETPISKYDLLSAKSNNYRIFCFNSVREIYQVELID